MDEAKMAEGAVRAILGYLPKAWDWMIAKIKGRKRYSNEELKALASILFIDDEKFEYIDLIRNAGWNATQIFELQSTDNDHVKRADVIFLDYKGVGKILAPSEEGIGLLRALKQKFPDKPIIFYSAHAGFSLGDKFDLADDWLSKGADPHVYIQKIEEHVRKKYSV